MKLGRSFWKLVLGQVLLIVLLWTVCVLAILRESAGGQLPAEADQDRWHRFVLITGLAGLLAAIGLALGFAILWRRRIACLSAAAHALAHGDLDTRWDASGSDDVALLTRSLNRLADRFNGQAATIASQRQALESVISRLSEGVVVAGNDGRIVLINQAAARLLGLPDPMPEGVVNDRGLTVEQTFPQHDLQRLLLPKGAGASHSEDVRLNVAAANGPVSLLARASDIVLTDSAAHPSADGRTAHGRLVVLTDVTELTKAVRLRSDFVANASHELRTPLSAIRAAAETLLTMNLAKEHEVAPRFVETIARHVRRLEVLITDLLDLSRVEYPGARFAPSNVGIHRMVDDLHAHWGETASERGLRFETEVSEDCTTLLANPRLLRLVLDNLLDNAMKFTDRGGRVSLRVRRRDASVSFEVRDDGCGISRQEHERVFERFYQVSPSRSEDAPPGAAERGTGLGLSIVKHAVAAMSGEITLDSEPGKGTCVTVVIPLAPSSSAAAADESIAMLDSNRG
jgi:two-component system phosphate regulon sensor histidine kinase PhoR